MRAREVELIGSMGYMDHGARPDNPRALQFSVRVHVSLVIRVCPGLPSPSPTDSINIESLGA